jgi:hypothetical protein
MYSNKVSMYKDVPRKERNDVLAWDLEKRSYMVCTYCCMTQKFMYLVYTFWVTWKYLPGTNCIYMGKHHVPCTYLRQTVCTRGKFQHVCFYWYHTIAWYIKVTNLHVLGTYYCLGFQMRHPKHLNSRPQVPHPSTFSTSLVSPCCTDAWSTQFPISCSSIHDPSAFYLMPQASKPVQSAYKFLSCHILITLLIQEILNLPIER